jgi:hypothetical protein
MYEWRDGPNRPLEYEYTASVLDLLCFRKITILWDDMPCSLVYNYQRLGGICFLYILGRRLGKQVPLRRW